MTTKERQKVPVIMDVLRAVNQEYVIPKCSVAPLNSLSGAISLYCASTITGLGSAVALTICFAVFGYDLPAGIMMGIQVVSSILAALLFSSGVKYETTKHEKIMKSNHNFLKNYVTVTSRFLNNFWDFAFTSLRYHSSRILTFVTWANLVSRSSGVSFALKFLSRIRLNVL